MCYLYNGNEPIVDKLMRHKKHKQDFVLPESYIGTQNKEWPKLSGRVRKRWDKKFTTLETKSNIRFSPTQKDEMVGTALLKNNLSVNSAHYITGMITLTAIHLKNYTEKLVLQTRWEILCTHQKIWFSILAPHEFSVRPQTYHLPSAHEMFIVSTQSTLEVPLKKQTKSTEKHPLRGLTCISEHRVCSSVLSRWGAHLCWGVGPSFPSAEVSSPAVLSKGLAQHGMVPLIPALTRAPDMDLGSSSGPESPCPRCSTCHPDQYGPCSNMALGHHHYHLSRWESWPGSQEWENYLHPSLAALHCRADLAPAKAIY